MTTERKPLEGTLYKRGEKGFITKGWKDRYFIQTDFRICYGENKEKALTSPLGFIDLNKVTKVVRNTQRQFGFEIQIPGRVYIVAAKSEAECNYWLNGIMEETKYLKSLDEMPRGSILINKDLVKDIINQQIIEDINTIKTENITNNSTEQTNINDNIPINNQTNNEEQTKLNTDMIKINELEGQLNSVKNEYNQLKEEKELEIKYKNEEIDKLNFSYINNLKNERK